MGKETKADIKYPRLIVSVKRHKSLVKAARQRKVHISVITEERLALAEATLKAQ